MTLAHSLLRMRQREEMQAPSVNAAASCCGFVNKLQHSCSSSSTRYSVPLTCSALAANDRPSWVITTRPNHVWKRRQPSEPCTMCDGSGERTCIRCKGRGRTNFVHLAMLPKGEWPEWCFDCRGSGLVPCRTCLGTGDVERMVGFLI